MTGGPAKTTCSQGLRGCLDSRYNYSIMKKIGSLLDQLDLLETIGDLTTEIGAIRYDSRQVERSDLFVAMKGLHTDGHRYIDRAVECGAGAILHSRKLPRYAPGVCYVRVPESRQALSPLSAAFFDYPSREMTVIGVTGTDGKSTTVWLIQQLLEACGRRSGFLSTVNIQTGNMVDRNAFRQSTPEAPEVQGLLRSMIDRSKNFAVLEATSHGLSRITNRLGDVDFRVGVLTNVTHEHLEFHGSLEQYRSDKANLFRRLKPERAGFAVLNRDDPNVDYFQAQAGAPVHYYSLKSKQVSLYASGLKGDLQGTELTLHLDGRQKRVHYPLPGPFNVENLLAALLTVSRLLDLDLDSISGVVPRLLGVKGRLEPVDQGQHFRVIIDYAHTPESFLKLFSLIEQYTPGSILTVFGSAGERDVQKRSRQGEIAAQYSSLIFLADEDPRGEDGPAILEEIAAGCPGRERGKDLFLEPDRRKAIRLALSRARPGDTVLLLGKGHEESIIYKNGTIPWDETEAARTTLKDLGFCK